MLHSLSHTLRTMPMVAPPVLAAGQLRRKSLDRPADTGTFVLPLKQSFIKDARLMPGTMRLLALLAGWAGTSSRPIETTQGILGKHLSRCSRQIYRYLQDAMEEGYLTYARTANRMGMVTGVRIWLNVAALRPTGRYARKSRDIPAGKPAAKRKSSAQTHLSDTNEKQIYRDRKVREFEDKLAKICRRNGFDPPF